MVVKSAADHVEVLAGQESRLDARRDVAEVGTQANPQQGEVQGGVELDHL